MSASSSTPARISRAANPWLIFLLCIGAALAAYAPALSGALVWDDAYLVGENPFFRSPIFGLEVFRHYLFFDSFSTYYRPVQNWSYMLDYWLWRGAPAGYHLTNILIHGSTGFLLHRVLLRLLPGLLGKASRFGPAIAGFVTLLWIVHPVHNAAVAYISGRADSLAACFALLAWLLLLRADEARARWVRVAWRGAAFVAILVALCAKEIALMWLVIFTAHLWWKGADSTRTRVATTAGVLAVVAIYAALHSLPAFRAPMEDAPPAPLAARVLLMLRALGDYAGLMLFPARLTMERTLTDPATLQSAAYWRLHPSREWLSLLGLLAILAAAWLCRWRAAGRELRIAGAAWFAVAFLPISNLFPLNAEVAEHWIYLASIGFLLLGAGTALALPARAHRWAGLAALLVAAAFCARTAVRSGDWVDAETFCQRTIAAGGASPRILATLAGIYGQRGEWTKQEHVLRSTLERYPDFTPARIQLGICLTRQGRAPEGESLLDLSADASAESARRFPRTWPAALNLARLRAEGGDRTAALGILREARVRFPEVWEIARYQSALLAEAQDTPAALRVVEEFASARWWHLDSWLELARLREAAGESDGAATAYEHASALDLYDGRSYAGLAQVELARHRGDAALTAQCTAISRAPTRPGHYLELGLILEQLGRPAEARAAVQKAQQLAARGG